VTARRSTHAFLSVPAVISAEASKRPWHGRVRGVRGSGTCAPGSHGRTPQSRAEASYFVRSPAGPTAATGRGLRDAKAAAAQPASRRSYVLRSSSNHRHIHGRRATGHAPARRALASSRPFRIGAVGSDFIDHGSETTGARLLAASGSGQARIGSKVYPFFQGKRRWKAY
jgi:hypothetical protein